MFASEPEKVRKLPAPADLGTAGRSLWDAITRQAADDGLILDQVERRVLRDAARTADDLAVLEDALTDASVTVVGSTGQPVPNRLFDEARKARQLIAALLKQLHLDVPDDPGAAGGLSSSSAGRRAGGYARWNRSASGIGG